MFPHCWMTSSLYLIESWINHSAVQVDTAAGLTGSPYLYWSSFITESNRLSWDLFICFSCLVFNFTFLLQWGSKCKAHKWSFYVWSLLKCYVSPQCWVTNTIYLMESWMKPFSSAGGLNTAVSRSRSLCLEWSRPGSNQLCVSSDCN